MKYKLPSKYTKLLVSHLLALVFVFGHLSYAGAAETCEDQFVDGSPAAIVTQQEVPREKGFFAKLLGRVKPAPKSPKPPPAPRVRDRQTQIRYLRSIGRYEEAEVKRAALEESLRTEKITELQYIGEGQSGAMLARFSGGGLGVVKTTRKYWQDPGAEVAAYELNKFFADFVMVPATVLGKLNGEIVSIQAYLSYSSESTVSSVPLSFKQRIRFFDYLIDNHDRRTANLLVDSEDFFAAIDNGIGFRSKIAMEEGSSMRRTWPNLSAEASWSLLLAKYSKDGGKALDMASAKSHVLNSLPPQWYYQKLKSTPDEVFEKLLSPYVSKEDVEAFIKRKDFLIQVTEEWLQSGHTYPNY